ncbi:MAG: SDR family NAD(P)-dependent oxidoreductase [Candidatus Binatia bacterium]
MSTTDVEGLKGKLVLVTGGGRGIGRAIALAFAAQGSHVVITGRNQATLDDVAYEIHHLGTKAKALALPCDITRKQEVESLNREITRRRGTVQVLVNNAGIAPAASFLEMDDHLWEEVLEVNLTGTYYCCKVFLPAMIALKWGRIINIASTMAKVAYSHISAYTTSKHAVLGLTRALALEMARTGVTVNAICPGYVDTELTLNNIRLMAQKTGKQLEDVLKLFKGTSPQNRLITPEEVADVAVMLASKAAGGMTGQAINVDGGAVMV